MAAPKGVNRPGRTQQARMERRLFNAVYAFAWRRLGKYRLSNADRDDVAQDVVIAAFCRCGTYRPDRGNLEQWLSGILRRQAATFLGKRGQAASLEADAALVMVSDVANPEESMFLRALGAEVLEFLPPDERRVVLLYELDGKTFEEIAAIEGIGVATAHARHKRGVAKIQQRMDEEKASGVILLPASLSSALGPEDGDGPPPDVVERAWRHVAAELGLDAPPPSEPPQSGTRQVNPGPASGGAPAPISQRRGVGLLRRLWPLAGVVLGGLAAGPALRRCGGPPESAHVAAAAPPITSAAGPIASATERPVAAPGASPRASAAPTAGEAPVASAYTPPPVPPRSAADREKFLVEQVGGAMEDGRLGDAAQVLAEYARAFPGKASTARRAKMWTKLCARYRAAPHGDDAPSWTSAAPPSRRGRPLAGRGKARACGSPHASRPTAEARELGGRGGQAWARRRATSRRYGASSDTSPRLTAVPPPSYRPMARPGYPAADATASHPTPRPSLRRRHAPSRSSPRPPCSAIPALRARLPRLCHPRADRDGRGRRPGPLPLRSPSVAEPQGLPLPVRHARTWTCTTRACCSTGGRWTPAQKEARAAHRDVSQNETPRPAPSPPAAPPMLRALTLAALFVLPASVPTPITSVAIWT